jgi:hypothetical protein
MFGTDVIEFFEHNYYNYNSLKLKIKNVLYIMESKIIIKKLSTPKTKKEPKPKKEKKSTGLKSKGQNMLVRNETYSRDLYTQRIEKLVKIAKARIKEEIEETQKRTPSNNEVDKIYKDRLNQYGKTLKKTMKSVAVGGPASLL